MKFNSIFTIKRFVSCIFVVILSANIKASYCYAQLIPTTTDSRIRTLVYNPNEVYELKFYYGYQSFIEFADNEEIEMISIGEAFAWRITPSGKRLFIRPLEVAAHTNMTIISNKRTYHFDIRSDEYSGKADEELVYTVRFYYPQIGQPLPLPPQLAVPVPLPKKPIVKAPASFGRIDDANDSAGVLALNRNPDNLPLNFDYSLAGKSDNIMPVKVYDNGKETFMQFANDNLIVPGISAVDAFGIERPLTYVIREGYVTLSTVERQYTLRLADSLICVYNNSIIGK